MMILSRRSFLQNISLIGALPSMAAAGALPEPIVLLPDGDDMPRLIAPPVDPEQWPAFREKLTLWRKRKMEEMKYDGSPYRDPAFEWAAANLCCCFLMMYDLDFFDPQQQAYTVDKVLRKGQMEFGGYDSVVLWHAYPRIGIDDRNQFDFYRDMPGGLAGIRKAVDQFHAKNVRVFVNYNPWDTSTRREGKRDVEALAEMIAAIDADGIFLDTLKEAEADYREKLDRIKPGIVLEGEFAADLENLPANHLSWAQWFSDGYVPGILRNKWFERKHIQHQIARWDRDHTTELQQAWMNGSGMMVWENVFGQWLGWNERDKSILRSMLPIQRRYIKLFNGEGWTPLVPTNTDGVFASLWEEDGVRLWTFVNRNDFAVTETVKQEWKAGEMVYDLIRGVPAVRQESANIELAARSIGCVVAGTKNNLGKDFDGFIKNMKQLYGRYNGDTAVPEMRTEIRPYKKAVATSVPPGMAELHPHSFNQAVELMVREAGGYTSSMPINVSAQLGKLYLTHRQVHIPHMAIDKTPVTNKQFHEFLLDSKYRPAVPDNFLKHWQGGRPQKGKEDHPVVYVDLEDARAYAAWAGKRLPSEPEWQFAAQGYGQWRFPWGQQEKKGAYNDTNGTTSVYAYPSGASPFGCLDMCGNTWEWTESEHHDKYNRFCMLKGGSFYAAKDSMWYTSGGLQPAAHATKFLLMYPGLDRCATIGFRCAADL